MNDKIDILLLKIGIILSFVGICLMLYLVLTEGLFWLMEI